MEHHATLAAVTPEGERRAADRREADFAALARDEGQAPIVTVKVKNLSTDGCRVIGDVPFELGTEVWVKVTGMVAKKARVAWTRPGEAGCEFLSPFAPEVLDQLYAMQAEMAAGEGDPSRLGDWSLALLLAWGATAAILFSATVLYKWLGRSVLTAIERLMGMLLVAISVQMVLDGIGAYLKLTPPNI